MVDEGIIRTQRIVPHFLEFGLDLSLYVVVISDILQRRLGFFSDTEGQGGIELVDKLWKFRAWESKYSVNTDLLYCGRLYLEMCRDIATENTSFESFDVSTNVCFGCNQVTIVHLAMYLFVTIWHDDLATEGLNL